MRIAEKTESRIVGQVNVRVASQVVPVPLEAARLAGTDRTPGFFTDAAGTFGILVDSTEPEFKQREAIERATVDAARFLGRKFLN